jgi:hypothetical protein
MLPRTLSILTTFFFSLYGFGQNAPNIQQKAGTSQCSNVAVIGNNSTVNVTCHNVDKGLANQISALVAKSSQDAGALKEIAAKLAVLISEVNNQPSTTTVTSFNQQGGITAGQVNITGSNAVQVSFQQTAFSTPNPDGSYVSNWIVTLSGLVPRFAISVSNPSIVDWNFGPEGAGIIMEVTGTLPNGDSVHTIQNAAGRYILTVHTKSPTASHISYGCDGIACVGPHS